MASAVASPTRAIPTDTTAPSPASPPRRLASAPPDVDASAASSPASAHSGDQLSASDASSPLLASRSEEYRLLFRLPPDEVLVQDFNCALQENILLQGHMYLFLHHICFYSNIFGYETKKTIPLQEVTDIRKAKTAAIFPNAIEIIAGSKRHFFGSFLSRDEAYKIIVDGWEQHASDARVLLECQDAKSASSSEENVYPLLEGAKGSKQDKESPPLDRSVIGTAVTSADNADSGDSDINISKRFSKVQEDGIEDNTIALNPFSLGPVDDDDAPNVPESYTMIAESKFQVSVEVFFNLLLSDGAFGFLDDFHKKCGDKEFSCSKWRLDEQKLVRDVSFLHPIKIYLGAKFGTCQEVQKLRIYKNRHLVIQTSQSIGDAPYGDHFTVEGIWDVEQDSLDGSSCYLRVYINVTFSKKTIFRGKIEQSTKDECREVFGLWIKLGHDLLKQESNSRSKDVCSSTNADLKSWASANRESTLENTVPKVTSTQEESGVRSIIPLIQDQQQRIGRDSSILSTSQEFWGSLTSYMRSNQLGPLLAVALVAIIILMQVTIIVLLTRAPQVQMAPLGASVSSKESIEWVGKRMSLLGEEMQLAEAHMERMRHEFAWLRSHLERLERLRGSYS
ncbi:protein VASCULAR ASSOCIATED DEATH 1, chloroplastic-like isoform X2 [Phragmites australis]|uniref:protein VASCULAR ASSOCIATED DEATH 1, chloroplastic-like isoform X2 n=1 Tax=Phragmites australis TaxID=29695 RepID=UPI002D78910D|nr:protein VASCULAR ASSOCIATED DEATH 1, chloroplastic-like isoform X2 [Phragmites australis]